MPLVVASRGGEPRKNEFCTDLHCSRPSDRQRHSSSFLHLTGSLIAMVSLLIERLGFWDVAVLLSARGSVARPCALRSPPGPTGPSIAFQTKRPVILLSHNCWKSDVSAGTDSAATAPVKRSTKPAHCSSAWGPLSHCRRLDVGHNSAAPLRRHSWTLRHDRRVLPSNRCRIRRHRLRLLR